jgi:glutathione S-transferase
MDLVAFVAGLALVEYWIFTWQCGRARGRLGVAAPATTGNPEFERYLRVQYNTIEQLVIFLPAIFGFAYFASPAWAAALGLVFIVGRALFARGYVRDPAQRGPGFGLTLLANTILLLGSLVGALVHAAR